MNTDKITEREQLLAKIRETRAQYTQTAATMGVKVQANNPLQKAREQRTERVCRFMARAQAAQQKVISARVRVEEKESLRIKPSSSDKRRLAAAEKTFLTVHGTFEKEYNKAQTAEYYQVQRKIAMIGRYEPEYEPPKYNRDAFDAAVGEKAAQKGICTTGERFADTIVATRYSKGDFGTKYMDGKLFLSKTDKTLADPMSSLEMLSVAIKDVVSDNPNVAVACRAPKSKEEQALINMKIKSAIAGGNEEMVSFIEETRIEKALAQQELALEQCRFELGVTAEKAFKLQRDIVQKRTDRDILLNCGKDLSRRDLRKLTKDGVALERCFNEIDAKLDSVLTFNKMDKEDYWQQIEMLGKERYKESYGIMDAPELPEESLSTTIEKQKSLNPTTAFTLQTDDVGLNVARPVRQKTDIVKVALEQERAKYPRELSPDPAVKSKTLSAPQLKAENE